MKQTAPVLIMAGGTGGHVFPALAVAESLRGRGIPVIWLGTRTGLEATLVPKAGIPLEWIEVAGLRGKGWRRRLLTPFMLIRALWQARAVLRRVQPRVILGMGGFVSGPGGVMARLLGIPLVIHEQNAIAGLTNRWLARVANQTLQAFPNTFPAPRRAITVGNPVRQVIAALPLPAERFAGRQGRARLLVGRGGPGLNEEALSRIEALLAGQSLPAGDLPARPGLYWRGLGLGFLTRKGSRALWSDR